MIGLPGFLNPRRLLAERMAATIAPPERLSFDQWLPQNLILIDGPQAGEPWGAEGAPYLPGIAECLSDDHPCNLVTVRKCQQSGASILALGWCLYVADREPANMLYGVPGIDALKKLNNTKLQPLTDAFHKHIKRTVILPQMSRSGDGSTTYEKKFAGGFLVLGNANSVMDLSSITVRKGVKDEVSKWADIPGYGDPEKLFFGRFTAHRRVADWKIFEISTPEVDSGLDDLDEAEGHCRIDRSFRKSDQRHWHCPCPECGALFVHRFENFLIDTKAPHKSVYACDHCGHHVTEAERVAAVRAGVWQSILPEADRAGRHPGFHVDAFISLMMSYQALAEDCISAKTETEKKAFANLNLGLPYKYGGDAPDHVRLMERREADMVRGHVPPRGLILTAFADVQMRGMWLLVIAHAPNREKWVVEAEYIDGDTSDMNGAAFEQLRKALDREYLDAFGGKRRIDALGIDSGYRSHIVYSWVRRHQRVHPISGHDVILATKGLKGWGRPAIGQPKLMDISLGGKIIREGVKVWGLGTWPLKSEHYTNLHLAPPVDDTCYPDGYCHHGKWLDEQFFRQITAESLQDIRFRGRVTGREWVRNGPNHYLDCYVGNHALGEYLGISSTTREQWAALAAQRGMPAALVETDLFSAPAPAVTIVREKTQSASLATPSEPKRAGWIEKKPGWLS